MSTRQPHTPPWQQLFFALLSIGVSTAVFLYLRTTISLGELADIIRNIPLVGLALFVLFSLTMSLFRTWRYLILLRISGHEVGKTALFLITLVRNFFSDLLPARIGTLIYIYLVRSRLGVSWRSGSASFAYSFLFDIISLAVLILLATLAASGLASRPGPILLAGLLLGGCAVAILLLLPWLLQWCHTLLPRLRFLTGRFTARLGDSLHNLREELLLLQQSGQLLRVLALSFGVRCTKYLSLYVLLLGLVLPLGHTPGDFPLPKVFFGLTAAELAASLPISGIAGFGAYEGAWSLVFQLLGYPEKLAALTSVSHHLLTQVWGYSIGGLAFLLLLLPWQHRQQQVPTLPKRQGAIRFYLQALLLLVIPLLCALFVFLNEPATRKANGATPTPSAFTTQQPAAPPPGKVVYQRPNGIYRVTVGSRDEVHLSRSGSAPRWSPDGRQIAFVDSNRIMLMTAKGTELRTLATAEKAKAVCFHPDGHSVLYTDRTTIKSVDIRTAKITPLAHGNEFFELDISHDGKLLVATEKKMLGGYKVVTIDLQTGNKRTISRGCSASISPDGRLVTVNGSNHRKLLLYESASAKQAGTITMVEGKQFDNQYWANSPDWLASKSEGDRENIYLHHVFSSAGFQVTFSGQCDRPDYFVEP